MSSGFEAAEHQLRSFFYEAAALDRAALRRLRQAGRQTPGRVSLQTTPEFLSLVASAAWTPEMEHASRRVWAEAAAVARRICPGLGRRAVTRGLAGAGLVILTDWGGKTTFPPSLRDRLSYAWRFATEQTGTVDDYGSDRDRAERTQRGRESATLQHHAS